MFYDIYLYTLCYYICCLLGACMRCTWLCSLKPGVTSASSGGNRGQQLTRQPKSLRPRLPPRCPARSSSWHPARAPSFSPSSHRRAPARGAPFYGASGPCSTARALAPRRLLSPSALPRVFISLLSSDFLYLSRISLRARLLSMAAPPRLA
jgi:hypothetical protein